MGRHRLAVIALVLVAVLATVVLLATASRLCPGDLPGQACPGSAANRLIVVSLAAVTAGLFVGPFAFLGDFMARRRIVYRGAWWRAVRRGALVAAVLAAIAGLRLGGALTIPIALFVVALAAAVEWFAVRYVDLP
jgi:hypothetical protein